MIKISASIICMNSIDIHKDLIAVENLVDMLHADIMDGIAVPRYGIYPELIDRIGEISDLPVDVHLMVDNLELAINRFSECHNVERINFHVGHNPENTLKYAEIIKEKGKKAGIIFNLSDNISNYERLEKYGIIDSITFMGIHPGILKQKHRSLDIIQDVKLFISRFDKEKINLIQIDGGVCWDTINKLIESGINCLVCGSATIFSSITFSREEAIKNNIARIKQCIKL